MPYVATSWIVVETVGFLSLLLSRQERSKTANILVAPSAVIKINVLMVDESEISD
jgi:hypothetical protein